MLADNMPKSGTSGHLHVRFLEMIDVDLPLWSRYNTHLGTETSVHSQVQADKITVFFILSYPKWHAKVHQGY